MVASYGVRYLTAAEFIRHCAGLNIKADLEELEHYEKNGVMLPVARVAYPREYVMGQALWETGDIAEPPNYDKWPDLGRLFEKARSLPKDFSDLTDEELVHSFDREMGRNKFIEHPNQQPYKPWGEHAIVVLSKSGKFKRKTAEHYYSQAGVPVALHPGVSRPIRKSGSVGLDLRIR